MELGYLMLGKFAKYWPKAVIQAEDRKYLCRLSSRLSRTYYIPQDSLNNAIYR